MPLINRSAVAAPTLPQETVEVSALQGAVYVRGLLLTERLAVNAMLVNLRAQALADAPAADAPAPRQPYDASKDINSVLPMLLALCVLDADFQPLWTEAQWQIFGGKHQGPALELFNIAWRLGGFDQAQAEKN